MCWRERIKSSSNFGFSIADFGFEGKTMSKAFWVRFSDSPSDNRKSKIQNRKLAGIAALIVKLAMCGAAAEAQQPKKVPLIGYLASADPTRDSTRAEGIRQRLRELGYIEGQNIAIEYRYAEGKVDQFAALA